MHSSELLGDKGDARRRVSNPVTLIKHDVAPSVGQKQASVVPGVQEGSTEWWAATRKRVRTRETAQTKRPNDGKPGKVRCSQRGSLPETRVGCDDNVAGRNH